MEREIFHKLAEKNKLNGYLIHGYFIDIGLPETYNQFIEDMKMKKIIISQPTFRGRSPLRINFAACGNDLETIFKKYNGMVLSATIDKYCHATIKKRNDNEIIVNGKEANDVILAIVKFMKPKTGFELEYYNDVPYGRGLGSSGSFIPLIISLIGKILGIEYDNITLVEMSKKVETEYLGIKGGWQDQYSSVNGGINFMEFSELKHSIFPLNIPDIILKELSEHLFLVYTGEDRKSGLAHEKINYKDKLKDIFKIKGIAKEIAIKLASSDIKIDELLRDAWESKRRIISNIININIDKLYGKALSNGALGGKLMGAGDGGYFLLYCNPKNRRNLIEKLNDYEILTFNLCKDKLEVWEAK